MGKKFVAVLLLVVMLAGLCSCKFSGYYTKPDGTVVTFGQDETESGGSETPEADDIEVTDDPEDAPSAISFEPPVESDEPVVTDGPVVTDEPIDVTTGSTEALCSYKHDYQDYINLDDIDAEQAINTGELIEATLIDNDKVTIVAKEIYSHESTMLDDDSVRVKFEVTNKTDDLIDMRNYDCTINGVSVDGNMWHADVSAGDTENVSIQFYKYELIALGITEIKEIVIKGFDIFDSKVDTVLETNDEYVLRTTLYDGQLDEPRHLDTLYSCDDFDLYALPVVYSNKDSALLIPMLVKNNRSDSEIHIMTQPDEDYSDKIYLNGEDPFDSVYFWDYDAAPDGYALIYLDMHDYSLDDIELTIYDKMDFSVYLRYDTDDEWDIPLGVINFSVDLGECTGIDPASVEILEY